MSLLLDAGHVDAGHYPISTVWDEAGLVIERRNAEHATAAGLIHGAIVAVWSKEGSRSFTDRLEGLDTEIVPQKPR